MRPKFKDDPNLRSKLSKYASERIKRIFKDDKGVINVIFKKGYATTFYHSYSFTSFYDYETKIKYHTIEQLKEGCKVEYIKQGTLNLKMELEEKQEIEKRNKEIEMMNQRIKEIRKKSEEIEKRRLSGHVTRVIERNDFPKSFRFEMMKKERFSDGKDLFHHENLKSWKVGQIVEAIFQSSWKGEMNHLLRYSRDKARALDERMETEKHFKAWQEAFENLDKSSIHFVRSVSWFIQLIELEKHNEQLEDIETPDIKTSKNIMTMVERALTYFDKDRIQFSTKIGYANAKNQPFIGIVDIFTDTALMDLKCYRQDITGRDSRQIILYYIIALKMGIPEIESIETLGLFNARLNVAHTIQIKDIPLNVIEEISQYIEEKDLL